MKKIILGLCAVIAFLSVQAQETFPRNDVKDDRTEAYAFTNATIVVDHQTTLENGTLLIRNGRIEKVGTQIQIPQGYETLDLDGNYLYPSMIDLHTAYGMPKPERRGTGGGFNAAEQIQSKEKGAFNANESIKSQFSAAEVFEVNSKDADDLRKNGFGAVLTFRSDGLARGTSALVCLGEGSDNEELVMGNAAAHYSLSRGISRQNYPRSMMGYISLLRQTYLDAEWFAAQSPRPFADQSLEAWLGQQSLPQMFDAGNWLNVLRADKIGDEFGVQYTIKSGGDAYKRIAEVKATGASLVVPVNFPDAYDVVDAFDAERVSYGQMLHWELAATNPGVLEQNDISFALTAAGLKNKKDFLGNIRKAIKHGLSEGMALQAVTQVPAKMLGMEDRVGRLGEGMLANFLITSGKLFDEKTIIHENWVQGKPFRYKPLDAKDHGGKYMVSVSGTDYNLEVSGDAGSNKAKIVVNDSTTIDVTSKFSSDLVTLSFKPIEDNSDAIRLSGWVDASGWKGKGQLADGTWIDWSAERTGDLDKKADGEGRGARGRSMGGDRPGRGGGQGQRMREQSGSNGSNGSGVTAAKDTEEPQLGQVIYPFVAYGNAKIPTSETILIKNTTVWTCEEEGVMENVDVLLEDGKIARVGANLSSRNARVIDGAGKHLTPGVIDEHTHIGGGGNDGATNSGMVRIGDQVNSEDVNIYRALAGGVTAVQVLHGSANPIGGQSALIKLRWGSAPEQLKINGADEFIKFALGENVKRSRNQSSIRYPGTRMGVEQVYMDAFSNAVEYEKEWKAWNALSENAKMTSVKPRRDLALEAMLEIVNGERFITCHSYVQSEINMLMKVAEHFGFKVNTFTHILEGYKVADIMAKHGAAASTFSDWWNYKWEVRYAIPYNATIMHNAGVLTAINSDDRNMMRRLNQEAGKSIKYGGMADEDALNMVTLNPAKMLHLDDHMGSIKEGKDADVVLWSDHPLSVYARAEYTIVDGTIYYSLENDAQARENLLAERNRLIQKMKDEKKSGGRMQRPAPTFGLEMIHCDDDVYEGLWEEHQH